MTAWGLIRRMLKEQPLRAPLVVLALVIGCILEGLGVASIEPLLNMIASGPAAAASTTVGRAISSILSTLHLPFTLGTVLALGLFFLLANQAFMLGQQKLAFGSMVRFSVGLRTSLYRDAFAAGWGFFLKEQVGQLANAMTAEADRAAMALSSLYQMLSAAIIIFVYIILALFLSWQMTILVGVVGLVMVGLLRGRVRRGLQYGQAITGLNAELQRELMENLSGAKLVKGSAVEDTATARFAHFTDRLASQSYRSNMNQAWVKAIYESSTITMLFVGIYVAITYFSMPPGSLVAFLVVFYRISPRLSNIQTYQHALLSYLPGLGVIEELDARAKAQAERTGGVELGPLTTGIALRDVAFAYDPGGVLIEHLDLTIPCGKTVALVGQSGSGKTTIVDLVMALMRPSDGTITADGVSLDEVHLASWRRKIGYVAQDAVMFRASIKDNLLWSAPDATEEEMLEATRLACADEFISEMPEGYGTIVGDRGVRLSGGQRQRLALARAILRKPEILVLDEATSALDAESERLVQDAIAHLGTSMTIIEVTHRLATVQNADEIYVLEHGRIVEHGSWDELTARGGRFEELVRLQALDSGAEA